jgi:hypothetical protein
MSETPNQYRYLGDVSSQLQQEFQEWQSSDYHRAQVTETIGEELPLSESQQQQFSDVFEATKLYYADQLGIDISDRTSSTDNVHLLSDENFRLLQQRMGIDHEGIEVFGFQLDENDLVVRETGDPAMDAYIVQHEKIHMIGQRAVRMIQNGDSITPRELRRGLQSHSGANEGSRAMEEYTAEATTRDIITNYWPKFDSLRALHPEFVAHEGAIELGNVVADGIGISRDQVLHDIQRAHIFGDMGRIQEITEALGNTWGSEATRQIAMVTSARAGELAIELAKQTKS